MAFFQSITHPDYTWRSWDPVSSFDSFLWNYTPDIHAIQERVLGLGGLGELSEKYNIDPRILALVMVLPLVLLLLTACVVMGARSSSEDGPRYPGQKTDPTLVGGSSSSSSSSSKKTGQSGSVNKQHQKSGSSSTSGASLSKRGAKKQGGPSDGKVLRWEPCFLLHRLSCVMSSFAHILITCANSFFFLVRQLVRINIS